MRLIITEINEIYLQYVLYRACCKRATQPYSLGGGGTIYPGSRPAGVTTRIPRMETRVFTHSLDVNQNVLPFHGICMCMYNIVFTVSQCHADV